VTYGGGESAIRFTSDLHNPNNIIGTVAEGTIIKILDGPICSYNWIVWVVEGPDGLRGYTPESDGDRWFLEPVP
jgi:hypothetical protein